MKRTALFGGILCLAAALALVSWRVIGPAARDGAAPARSAIPAQGTLKTEEDREVSPPGVLHGTDADRSAIAWHVDVTLLEGEARTPIADEDIGVALAALGHEEDREVYREGRTDAEGRVSFDLAGTGLGPDGLRVHAETRRHLQDKVWHVASAEGGVKGRLACEIVLVPGVSARGVVVPPPGVRMEDVRLWQAQGDTVRPVSLAPDGSFGWDGWDGCVEGETFTLVAAALGDGVRHTGHGKLVAGLDAFSLVWSELRPGDRALLRVVLRDEAGRPVRAVLGWSETNGQGSSSWSSRSVRVFDGEGLLEFEAGPQRLVHLVAFPGSGKGLGTVALEPFRIAEVTEVEIVFPPERVLTGRVVRKDGGPVEGLRLALGWPPTAVFIPLRPRYAATAVSDASGRFTFEERGLGEGAYVLSVLAPSDGRVLAEVPVRPEARELEVVVEPGEDVALQVVDEDDAPVVGATVEISLPPPGVVLDPAQDPYDTRAVRFRVAASAVTDAEGRVVLPDVDLGRLHRLVVRAPDAQDDFLPFEVQGWRPREECVHLERGFFIAGRVEDDVHAPVAGQGVDAVALDLPHEGADVRRNLLADGTRSWHRPSDRTDDEGAFCLGPLRAGRWRIGPDSSASGPGSVEVEIGPTIRDLVLVLSAAETAPDVELRLHVLDLAPEDRGTPLLTYGGVRGHLDAEGRIVVPFLRPDETYEIWIAGLSGGRYVWEKGVRAGTGEVEVRPRRGGTFRGRVRLPEGVKLDQLALWPTGPLINMLTIEATAGSLEWTVDVEAGTFEVRGVPPGTWTVFVWGQAGDIRYEAEFEASPGDDVVVDLG